MTVLTSYRLPNPPVKDHSEKTPPDPRAGPSTSHPVPASSTTSLPLVRVRLEVFDADPEDSGR
jgi:hypothetical protein